MMAVSQGITKVRLLQFILRETSVQTFMAMHPVVERYFSTRDQPLDQHRHPLILVCSIAVQTMYIS